MTNRTYQTTETYPTWLPERDRQPVIVAEVYLYPSELIAVKQKITDMLASVDPDSGNPDDLEVFEGMTMIFAALKRSLNDVEAAIDKAGV